MSSASDSEGERRKGKESKLAKEFRINSSGNPVNWDGENWVYYRKMMKIAFQKSLLLDIAEGKTKEQANWSTEEKDDFTKKQAKIQSLIMGSLTKRLSQLLIDIDSGTEMWSELSNIYEGKKNDATKAQKVYRLQGELHRTHLRANGDVRGHLYTMFRIQNELKELGSPLSDLQMVDLLLRSLPQQVCYNELRRKVLFSSNMSKYTPSLVRELVLTAEARSKDWEKNAFGNNQGKKKQGNASDLKSGSKSKSSGEGSKKKTSKTDIKCFNCGEKGHYKSDCPELEEKPRAEKKASAKMARSGEKPTKKIASEQIDDDSGCVHKRDVVVSEVVKKVAKDYDASRWYFDSGTNVHITACKEYFTVLNNMEDSDWNPNISGFADGVDAKAEGFGTVVLATVIDEEMVFVYLEDVLYVPKAGCNLFSPGQALEHGFKMSWDQESLLFGMSFDGAEVLRAVLEHRLWAFNAHNVGGVTGTKKATVVKKQVVANFAVTDGVEDIDVWHARLGHTCPEYIRLMVDRGMAKGIMLKKRGKMDCADCHFGKQRRKTYRKSLERNIARVNDMIFADLLIPGLHNGTRYSAVLVVMDGFSRFVTTYLLKSKSEDEVNGYMKQYIAWAERQHGRRVDTVVTRRWDSEEQPSDEQEETIGPVKQVLTDKGAEFCNNSIERWYAKKGIVHTKVGPKSSQLNLVERTHQTLIGMVKTMMHESGLPRSFWMHALQTAVYIKNRVFCKGAGRTPYEMMYGAKPDIHHIRTFGSLVYCHTPLAKRKKLEVNCRVGFLIGYQEDIVGCQVYFPTEHQKGFVADVKVNESIMFKDRYGSEFKTKVNKWLQTFDAYVRDGDFDDAETESVESQRAEGDANSVQDNSDVEMQSAASADDLDEAEQVLWNDMVRGSVLPNVEESSSSSDLAAHEQQLWEDILRNSSLPDYDAYETQEGVNADAVSDDGDVVSIEVQAESDDVVSIEVQAESDVDEYSNDDPDIEDDEPDIEDDEHDVEDDEQDDISGATGELAGASSSHGSDLGSILEETESDLDDDNDYDYLFDPSDAHEAQYDSGASDGGVEQPEPVRNDVLAIPSQMLIGKVHPRDEEVRRTSDKKRAKVGVKLAAATRRPGLREVPSKLERLEDYDVYSAFKALHADRRSKGGLRASDIKIPKSYRQAMRSKQASFWREAMDAEMAALKDKGVLRQIPRLELPCGQQTIKTMWVFDVKTDHLGYIVRYRPRVVARGDKQRFGIDYTDTFSPVARMATFRAFVAVCILLNLTIYQGDINTAYLNAALGIKQYLEEVEGYPCDDDGMIYIIEKALYGLRQSGREWNSEVNRWFLKYGFKQCETEPCLYFYDRDGEFAIVLLYVDDILCATNNAEFKKRMFEKLDSDYGLKDQGLLNTYLGVQVEQNADSIKIHQTKYCEDIIERFNFADAHPSRIPMETNMRLTVKDNEVDRRKEQPANGKKFPYRELVGSLMYLTTCTRPDLAFSVGQLSRYVQNPTQQHIGAAKRVLRYLVGTKTQGIVYTREKPTEKKPELIIDGYCDSDWGNDPDTRKSITGFVHCMAGGAVSWASRRQTIVAQSTAEAEYVAACEACMEGQGLRNILTQVFPDLVTKVRMGIDNQAAYVMATNPTYSRRTRHIELRWHYVRDQVAKKTVDLWKVKTDVNPSDLMTKPLAGDRLETLSAMIGLTKQHLPQ